MHETHLIGNILRYLEEEEKRSRAKIEKIYVSISEFGGLTKEHFMEHFQEGAKGTKWGSLAIEFKDVPYGPELEITKLEFKKTGGSK